MPLMTEAQTPIRTSTPAGSSAAGLRRWSRDGGVTGGTTEAGGIRWHSTPPQRDEQSQKRRRRIRLAPLLTALVLAGLSAWVIYQAVTTGDLPAQAALTLVVFCAAVWLWIFSPLDDTYVALGAALVLVAAGALDDEELFAALGEDTVWLLLAAFVVAAGVTASGLATRVAGFVVTGAGSMRQLTHLITAVLVASAFAVPSTSGRAALALPVFIALAMVLKDRRRVVVALGLLFPTVILLSAVASYLGAGAHLITAQILTAAGEDSFSFARWLMLGLPLAVVSSHLAAEIVLMMFTRRADRREPLRVSLQQIEEHADARITGPMTTQETRAAMLVSAVVVLWCSEPLHGIHPAIIALVGALLIASPAWGSVKLAKALKGVPWSLLLFMAATLALGTALVGSGAAEWLAHQVLLPVESLGEAAPYVFVIVVVLISTMAHLVIQSRSARSAVLIPIIVALAPGLGVEPAAVAFASTAAAGFCHTLTSSAKPVTLFSDVEGIPTYTAADLLRLSAVLAPVTAGLVLIFSFFVWPHMGLPLFR